jgi:CBS domain containing-hemolysin-like protein
VVPGLWRPDELSERVGAEVPDDANYETVGGFVMARLGRVPTVGDEVHLAGGRMRVLRMDGRRVDRLRYEADGETDPDRHPDPDPHPDPDAPAQPGSPARPEPTS